MTRFRNGPYSKSPSPLFVRESRGNLRRRTFQKRKPRSVRHHSMFSKQTSHPKSMSTFPPLPRTQTLGRASGIQDKYTPNICWGSRHQANRITQLRGREDNFNAGFSPKRTVWAAVVRIYLSWSYLKGPICRRILFQWQPFHPAYRRLNSRSFFSLAVLRKTVTERL